MGSEAQFMTRVWKKEIKSYQHKMCGRCGSASTFQDWGDVYYLFLVRTYNYTWETAPPHHEVMCPSCFKVFLLNACSAPSEGDMPCMRGEVEGGCLGCKYDREAEIEDAHYQAEYEADIEDSQMEGE